MDKEFKLNIEGHTINKISPATVERVKKEFADLYEEMVILDELGYLEPPKKDGASIQRKNFN